MPLVNMQRMLAVARQDGWAVACTGMAVACGNDK